MSDTRIHQDAAAQAAESDIELFIFAARGVVQGDTGLLNRIGLSPRDIPYLRQLSLAQLVAMSGRGSDLHAYLKKARSESSRENLEQALLQQGAPRELMMVLFRMSARRFSAERARLGVVGPRGRPMTAHMGSSSEQSIWRLWVILADDLDPRRLQKADGWLLIARELPGHLRSAWSLIQQWVGNERSMAAFSRDRAMLTKEHLALGERALRLKHGLELP